MEIHEIKAKLIEDYKEEIEDTHKYAKLSDEAYKMGEHEAAHTLCRMAHDEHRHACLLRKQLMKIYGYDPQTDLNTEAKWKAIADL